MGERGRGKEWEGSREGETFNLLPVDSHLTDGHVKLLGYVEQLYIKGPTQHMENVAIITQLIGNKCRSLKSGESVPSVFRVIMYGMMTHVVCVAFCQQT